MASADLHQADVDAATKLATEISLLLNEHDMATGLTAIGMVLGMGVLIFGSADAFFPALRKHAETVAEATLRARRAADEGCAGTA
jgi:hypothetical protein